MFQSFLHFPALCLQFSPPLIGHCQRNLIPLKCSVINLSTQSTSVFPLFQLSKGQGFSSGKPANRPTEQGLTVPTETFQRLYLGRTICEGQQRQAYWHASLHGYIQCSRELGRTLRLYSGGPRIKSRPTDNFPQLLSQECLYIISQYVMSACFLIPSNQLLMNHPVDRRYTA
jgi:hypothetical protein